jgi:hypothetical protein
VGRRRSGQDSATLAPLLPKHSRLVTFNIVNIKHRQNIVQI